MDSTATKLAGQVDADEVKQAASGRWLDILPAAGIPLELLDGKGHPCPKCGAGTDRFAAQKDVAERGAVICRQCFSEKNGDGFAAVQWYRGKTVPETVRWVADYVGVKPSGKASMKKAATRTIVATYDYRDADGNLLFQVVRYHPKDFRQRKPKPGGGWDWSTKGVHAVPYRLPELLAEPTRPVVVVEGEKNVNNLASINVLPTCNSGGAGKWTSDHSEFLRGRHVIILADNDEPGRKHAEQVAASLQGIAAAAKIVVLPGLPPAGDVSDWIAAGGTKEELKRLAKTSSFWAPATQTWGEIDSLDNRTLPEFPTRSLPGALRRWVEAESHATQTPPDLAGLLALASCSATIARHVVVQARPGWQEPVNLFTAILLDPGNRKSAVYADATQPLRELEKELIEAARPAVAREQSDRRQDEARLKKLEKVAAEKGDQEARHEARELAAELAEMPEPALPRLLVDDATSEKLGMMLAEQNGRIASMSPEGGVFDLMAGLYSKSGMPQFGVYLMGHSGDDLITDRVSRKSIHVERPALTCAYAMQPQVIQGLAENAAFRGRGLLARFLYAAPQSWIGEREIAPISLPPEVREEYRRLIRRLAASSAHIARESEPIQIHLAADALALFQKWETEIEAMLAEGGDMECTRDWGAKLAGATLRLAAVMHCVEWMVTESIGRETISKAIEIARYLIPHAEAVLRMMQASEETVDDDARYVLRWIRRHGWRDFTKREAQQHGRRRFPHAEDIDPALELLAQHNYIRPLPSPPPRPGRPPSPAYEANPELKNEHTGNRTQYTHNLADQSGNGSSEHCEYTSLRDENSNQVQVTI